MAGSGFVLNGRKMTSDAVVYSATQGTRADGVYYASIGSGISLKRRVEIVDAWQFAKDRLMKAMGYAANQLTLTQTELVCKVPLANVKGYTIVKQATTVAPEAGNLNVGFSWIVATIKTGRPQQMGSLSLDCAVDEIIHAYLRMNSKD
jgi:hypothetical protein